MEYRDKLISNISAEECEKLTSEVVYALRRMKEGMQSGKDTVLENIWDEYCVQIHGEESLFVDFYANMIETVIREKLKNRSVYIKQAIWLQTEEGTDWDVKHEGGGEEDPGYDEDAIATFILHECINPLASDWTNKRIAMYLEREHD